MSAPLHVLIVEDSADDALLVVRELERGGFAVVAERVETAAALRAALARRLWDVVLADYSLPAFSAPAALKVVQEAGLDLPFIVVSGTVGEDTAVEAMKAGAHDYLLKGRLKRLAPAVARELRERRARREAEAERRRLAEQVERMARTMEGILAASLDHLCVYGPDCRYLYVGRSGAAALGRRPEEMVDKSWRDLGLPPEVMEPFEARVREVFATGRSVTGELAVPLADGRHEYEYVLSPIRTDGSVRQVFADVRDVTERRGLESRARHLERLATLGQLLGGIAHELKNPLFVLTGFLQLFREHRAAKEYESCESDLRHIEEASQRMARIVERFRQLARPAPPLREPCDVQALVEKSLEFLANELMRCGIVVVRDLAEGLPAVRTDPHQLQQVFLNLMLNAIQAMAAAHGRGTLTVSAKPSAVSDQSSASESTWIEVRIQDDGPGIAPEHHAKLFEPFFTTKPPDQGTGLGFWTVRSILGELGGAASFEPAAGGGAVFIVRLPAMEGD